MERRLVEIHCGNEVAKIFVIDNKIKKKVLEDNFGAKGNLTYVLEDSKILLDSDDDYIHLEEKIESYTYTIIRENKANKPLTVLSDVSRKRIGEILNKFNSSKENSAGKKKLHLDEKVANKKQLEKNQEQKSSNDNQIVTSKKACPVYTKRVIHVKWLHQDFEGDVKKQKGSKAKILLNGADQYSVEDLKNIFMEHFMVKQEFSSINFMDCTVKIGSASGEEIDEWMDKEKNLIDIWAFSKLHRNSSDKFNLCLITQRNNFKKSSASDLSSNALNYQQNLSVLSGVAGKVKKGSSSDLSPQESNLNQQKSNVLAGVAPRVNTSSELPDISILKQGTFKEPSAPQPAAAVNKTFIEEVPFADINLSNIRLGKGGQGEVRRGMYHGTPVAVKSIGKGKYDKAVQKEISLLAYLRHPNIISILVKSGTPKEHHIVMEFFDGNSLYDILFTEQKQVYKLTEDNRITIAHQVTRAICYCHLNNIEPIIHRDIKPGNILVDKNLTTKVCDFGLGKCKDLRESLQSTIKKGVCGTYGYIPPEIFIDHEEATTASDVWSFGCTIAELFAEKSVWGSAFSGLAQMMKKESPKLQNIPRFLEKMLYKTFNYVPQERPHMKKILELFESLN